MNDGDKVYRFFSSKEEAEVFLDGTITLRSSYIYEMLEYAGVYDGIADNQERLLLGYGSTIKCLQPKFLLSCSVSKDWDGGEYLVEIDSAADMYYLIRNALYKEFKDESKISATLKCGNVLYLDPEEIRRFHENIKEEKKSFQDVWMEIKRKKYSYQNEWRIVLYAIKFGENNLGDIIKLKEKSRLEIYMESIKDKIEEETYGLYSYQDYLKGFREIKIKVGSLRKTARFIEKF